MGNQNPGAQGSVFQFLCPPLAKFCWEKPLLARTRNPEIVPCPRAPLSWLPLTCGATELPVGVCASGEPRAVGLTAWSLWSAGLSLNMSLNKHAAWGKLLSFSVPQFSPLQDGGNPLFPSFSIDSIGICRVPTVCQVLGTQGSSSVEEAVSSHDRFRLWSVLWGRSTWRKGSDESLGRGEIRQSEKAFWMVIELRSF